jgi:hypothetical protein
MEDLIVEFIGTGLTANQREGTKSRNETGNGNENENDNHHQSLSTATNTYHAMP